MGACNVPSCPNGIGVVSNHIFTYSLQFYLPDEGVINKDFLKAVLAGKKQLLRKE